MTTIILPNLIWLILTVTPGHFEKVHGWGYYVEDAVLKAPDEAISGWLFTPTIPGRPKRVLLARAA